MAANWYVKAVSIPSGAIRRAAADLQFRDTMRYPTILLARYVATLEYLGRNVQLPIAQHSVAARPLRGRRRPLFNGRPVW